MKIVGVDIGGTFTDLVEVDDTGALRIEKVPSTPPDFERGIRHAFQEAGPRGSRGGCPLPRNDGGDEHRHH